MEDLPRFVLETICEHIADCEPKRTSLWAFGFTSRTCYAATCRERFSRIFLNVVDEDHFREDLLRLEHLLSTADSKRYVRRVRVGAGPLDVDDDEGAKASFSIPPKLRYGFYVGKNDELTWLRDTWEQFAVFLSGLAVQDVIWAFPGQVPPCLLSSLQERNPTCRLHVQNFCLRSLHQRKGQQNIVDSEYMLATSPNLHRIIAPYSPYDPGGRADYNEEAIQQMAAGYTPRLRHVHLWFQRAGCSGELRSGRRRERLPWRGFHPQSAHVQSDQPQTRGQLESLTIEPGSQVDLLQITAWESHTDFSYLRALKFTMVVDLQALERLADLAQNGVFARLRVLDLPAGSKEGAFHPEIDLTMQRLLSSLQPLESLSAVRLNNASFDAALERHGTRLRHLHIEDLILYTQQINQLQKSCPNMKSLAVDILRTAGDETEVEIYRTLGSMPHLEKLTLKLYCIDYRHPQGPDQPGLTLAPLQDEDSQREMRVAMRQILINAALDERLAGLIFDELMQANASLRAPLPPKLSYIDIEILGAYAVNGESMYPDFQDIVRWIGRHWVCVRDPRDTHCRETIVKEVEVQTRLQAGDSLDDDIEDTSGSELHGVVWRDLWPDTGRGWKEEWRSFPLDNGRAD